MSSINLKIDGLAADWVIRRDLGPLSAPEQAQFEAWLAADVRHMGAYGRAEAVLARLERVKGVSRTAVAEEMPQASVWNRRRILIAGGAATAAAAGLGIALFPRGTEQETLSTQIGQMREIVLVDGSVVSLNTDSEIAVHFTREARNIELLKGEALFDVAKSKSRPFVVSAGTTQVLAVGTSFTVSLLPQKPVEVLVREGIVELKRSDVPEAPPVRASANVRAIVPPGAPIITAQMPEHKLARDLEWQHGRIALDNETLADAADEFARYSEVRIVVDPAVSSQTVTGLFASSDPVGFAKTAAAVLKLQTEVRGNTVRIFAE
jgi:transmembrane sensor